MMVKVGIIGGGSISEFHIAPYVAHEEVEFVAICEQNEQRLQQLGEKYGTQFLYQDYKELLKNPEIDAVSICTWNNTHAQIAIEALQAGKHVLVEKPLSTTVEDAERVAHAVAQSGKILQVGFVRRHAQNVHVLKKFIDAGEFGEIYYAKASCLRRLGNPGGWFSDISKSGGGPVMDLGVHMVDICWYLMGKPKPVTVSANTYKKLGNRKHIENLTFYQAADYNAEQNDVEDLANALIRFENGASLFIDVSFTLQMKQDEVAIKLYGEYSGAEIEPTLSIVQERHGTILNVDPQIDDKQFNFTGSFNNEINHFIRCIVNNEKNIAPVEDGLIVMKMLSAIYESAKLGKEVEL